MALAASEGLLSSLGSYWRTGSGAKLFAEADEADEDLGAFGPPEAHPTWPRFDSVWGGDGATTDAAQRRWRTRCARGAATGKRGVAHVTREAPDAPRWPQHALALHRAHGRGAGATAAGVPLREAALRARVPQAHAGRQRARAGAAARTAPRRARARAPRGARSPPRRSVAASRGWRCARLRLRL
jgi:hypothetical protein